MHVVDTLATNRVLGLCVQSTRADWHNDILYDTLWLLRCRKTDSETCAGSTTFASFSQMQ